MDLPTLVNNLTADLYGKIRECVPAEEVCEIVDGVVCHVVMGRCQVESMRQRMDPEEVMQEYTAQLYDQAMQALAAHRKQYGGESLMAHVVPEMITTDWAGKAEVIKALNVAYAENGAVGVAAALRRFDMPQFADRVTLWVQGQ